MKSLKHLEESGFPVTGEFLLDGKLHRFDRNGKKNAWYIGWTNFSQKGEPFEICVYGDWKTGEEYTYKSLDKVGKHEKKIIDDRLKEASKRAAEERRVRQEEAAKEAEDRWSQATENPASPYLAKKQIDSLRGCRSDFGAMGRTVLVPCRDVSGKLWGLQSIQPDGAKYFLSGQKVAGCFHIIGNNFDEIVVCEGFATAASIAQATGKTTFVAFSASNIAPVCAEIRKNWPEASILIAGDDDQFTASGNAGREKATEAAAKYMASVVFPKFQSLDSKPTDFNDLHLLEGLEAVRAQIGNEKPRTNFIRALGMDSGSYYYMSSECAAVIALPAVSHTPLNLLRLLPLDYWEMTYPSRSESGINWTKAASDLIEQCKSRGFFKLDSVRGVGVWQDDGRIVVNLGDCLWVDGRKVSILSFKSNHVYVMGQSIPEPHEKPLTDAECEILVKAVRCLNWKSKEHAIFFLGFLAISRFCGALKWRPHIWVTGGAGSGKSTVMEYLVHPVSGPLGTMVLGNTSEAGLRQIIGSDAKAIVFDEIETNDARSDSRVKNILDLVRQSSSQSHGAIVKGGKNGDPTSFRAKSCFAFSSIRVNLNNEADATRFTVLELNRGNAGQWESVQDLLASITPEYCERLFSRILRFLPGMLKNCEVFENVIREKFSPRFAQQYGILLAGYMALTTTGAIERKTAEDAVSLLRFNDQRHTIEESDEDAALHWLLEQKISVAGPANREDRSISELVMGEDSYNAVLELYGIKCRHTDDGQAVLVYIANSHPELQRFFNNTKWHAGWATSLLRLPGSTRERERFSKGNAKQCVKVRIAR